MDIILQPWTEENAVARVPMLSDARVLRWMSRNRSTSYNLQDSLARINRCRECGVPDMAIVADGVIVGGIALSPTCMEKPSFHYYVHPDHWGRGIATKAVALFLQLLARTRPHITTLHASAADGNTASHRVLLRNGFRQLPGSYTAVIFGGVEVQVIDFVLSIPTLRP